MSDDRRLAVLRAIVEDYIATEEPVGSKALAERHGLGVSPATVRNDMAVLEDEGYLTQPHTSAGRIPTDKGYRLFVDQLSQVRPLSAAERRAISTFLQGAVDLDDVVHRSVRLLSQLTGQVAVMQYPSLQHSSVRHVEVVLLPPSRLILVVIADTGRVEQRVVELPEPVAESDVVELRTALNARLVGKPLPSASTALSELAVLLPHQLQPALSGVLQTLSEMLMERSEERVVLGGTANLTRSAIDFPLTLRPVLEALEEQVVLLKLIGEAADPSVVQVLIGAENTFEGLQTTSVVTSGYGQGETALAGLGVLGPTRMDYPAAMTHVRAVARYVGQLLAEA